jgi:N-sulfoglucosamine sulfohydrolase
MCQNRFVNRLRGFKGNIENPVSAGWQLFRLALFMLTLIIVVLPNAGVHAADRPNILFCFADDWGRYASAYAKLDGPGGINDVIQTPNFDRVAREGVLFRRAFVSAPSCTPCRSALLSGQHFWRTGRGAILRGAVWDGSQPAYPLLLRDSGYHIGETYKVWSPGTPGDAPYGAGKHAYEKAGGRFNQFSQNVTRMVTEGRTADIAKQSLYNEVLDNFNAFLSARPADQPFCYWFGPTNVHRKWTKGSGKALWGINPDDLKGKMPPFLPDVPEMREDLADYFGEVQAFDAALGVLLKRLEETGELDNTMIVVSGDHGAPGFPHGKCNLYDFGSSVSLAMRWGGAKGGRVVDDLVSLTDLAPTFLELGGVAVPDRMTGRSLVEVLQSEKSGQVDPSRTAVFIGRERHVENARADFMPYPQRAIRTHDFLYIVNVKLDRWPLGDPYRLDSDNPPTAKELTEETRVSLPDEDAGPAKAWLVGVRNDPKWKSHFDWVYGKRPREELYDLRVDPHQTKNVAADPTYAESRGELEKRLMDELRRTGDPRLVDEGKSFETPPLAGPVPNEGFPKKKSTAK